MNTNLNFNLLATGVGSVPFLDVEDTCNFILNLFPDIPFWPQFVKLNPFEDMTIQASQGLPFIKINNDKNSICIDYNEDSKDSELISFYEHFLSEDEDHFSVGPEYAAGLYKTLELIDKNSKNYGPFIKGQIVGPITCAGILSHQSAGGYAIIPARPSAVAARLMIRWLSVNSSALQPIIWRPRAYRLQSMTDCEWRQMATNPRWPLSAQARQG